MGKSGRTVAIILLCGFIGIAFAIILQMLNTAEILVDELITATVTLREIQFIVVFVWFVIGLGVSAMDR